MRNTFINTLVELAKDDRRINLVVGDLGYSVVEEFSERYSDRFLNAGVSEQNMTGMAVGLALAGDAVVFTYSIGSFPTMRCLEQVRNDICFHKADVKIVAVGGGIAYGPQGPTHHTIEDFAIMRAMPGMVVAAPADPLEAQAIAQLAVVTPGPWYVRLGKNREAIIHKNSLDTFNMGKSIRVFDGYDGTVLATGTILYEAYTAIQMLADSGQKIRLLSIPFLKPFDCEAVRVAALETPWVMTIEEHHGYGGLGSMVAEVMAELGTPTPLIRLHLPELLNEYGSQEYLRQCYGLDAKAIAARIRLLSKN